MAMTPGRVPRYELVDLLFLKMVHFFEHIFFHSKRFHLKSLLLGVAETTYIEMWDSSQLYLEFLGSLT